MPSPKSSMAGVDPDGASSSPFEEGTSVSTPGFCRHEREREQRQGETGGEGRKLINSSAQGERAAQIR